MADDLKGVTVTVTDARNAGFCAAGMVKYLRDRGISYSELRDEGLNGARLAAYGDANFDKAVEVARERIAKERDA